MKEAQIAVQQWALITEACGPAQIMYAGICALWIQINWNGGRTAEVRAVDIRG